jgi:hypothetical protein
MDGLERLNHFDLGKHGDRHERDFWPLLSKQFPSYELLWRRLIVPLTCRIDSKIGAIPEKSIRLRSGIPQKYEQASMAHYSVFYFLGRAVKRCTEEKTALEYPEDVLFLLDSVGDNFQRFLRAMNELGADCGCKIFDASINQFPKGFDPFREISDYRDIFLHNTVIGRGIGVGKTYIPRWSADRSASPLERAKISWRAAEQLASNEMVGTDELLDRLIRDVFAILESSWQTALAVVMSQQFEKKMVQVTGLAGYLPIQGPAATVDRVGHSGVYLSLGSNSTFAVPWASGNYTANRTETK